jgi:molybdopterin-guanine dinucleotide biosynthesis protein A
MRRGTSGITGLVLAGGQGSRLGGRDKGLADWRGRPLIAHVLERLAPQVDCLLISANRNRETYAALGHPVVADTCPGYAGPLAGLQAGLAACTTPLLAMVPCDAPMLPDDLVARLADALATSTQPAAVAETGGRLQPTFLLCRRELLSSLESCLASGQRKLGAWLAETGAVRVPFDAAGFANLNTAADFGATDPP